jgi:hypothetical protein
MKETLHYVSFLKIQNNIIHKDQSKSKPNVRFLLFYKIIKREKYHKRWNTDEMVYIIVDNNIL